MNLTDLSTQLLFTTVQLWVRKPQETTSGTGFIYNVPLPNDPGRSIPLLVTNHHVVAGATQVIIELIERSGDEPVLQRRVRAQLDTSTLLANTDSRLDIALIPLGPLLNQLDAAGRPVFFRSIGPEIVPSTEAINDLSALEDIVFIGYPSGLRDEHNSTPLIRRGITASPVWNDFGNEPVFLIDAGVYPGSSGSPVFILNQGAYTSKSGINLGNRLLFLGLITSTILRPESTGNAYIGLGRVVKAQAVKAVIDAFATTVQSS